MPTGKTHEKVNKIFIHITVFLSFFTYSYLYLGFQGLTYVSMALIGYLFGTYYLSPDLDLRSRSYYRWKYIRFIWHLYQKTFSHRSFWTHGIIIGDIIRILYLIFIISILLTPIFIFFDVDVLKLYNTFITNYDFFSPFIISFVSGIFLASLLHIVSDKLVSYIKKLKYKKLKKRYKRNKK